MQAFTEEEVAQKMRQIRQKSKNNSDKPLTLGDLTNLSKALLSKEMNELSSHSLTYIAPLCRYIIRVDDKDDMVLLTRLVNWLAKLGQDENKPLDRARAEKNVDMLLSLYDVSEDLPLEKFCAVIKSNLDDKELQRLLTAVREITQIRDKQQEIFEQIVEQLLKSK